MTKINQKAPDAPRTMVFASEEWKVIYRSVNKTKPLPKKPPTVRQTIRWMAQLGGFLARKSDGEPGITTIWRGWQTVNTFLTLSNCG